MTIQEIANTEIRGEKTIKFPLKNDFGGWISDQQGHHILDIRGWGFLQYAENNKGEELQDELAKWVTEALNKEYNSTKN